MATISTDQYAALFSGLEDAVLVSDTSRSIVYANPAVERVFGWTGAELLGRPTSTIEAAGPDPRGPDQAPGPAPEGSRHLACCRRRNGETFASETVTSEVRDGAGTPVGSLLVIRDVTDRLAAERKAVEAAATLEDAIAAIDDGFALFDADDRLAVCNDRYREVYPRSADGIVAGATFAEILRHGLDSGEYDTGDMPEAEWFEARLRAHRRADGTRIEQHLSDGRWVQIRERRTRQGGTAGIRADITSLKAAQRQIALVRRERETLANNMPCLIEELDRDARCVFINDVGACWLGTTGAEAERQRTGQLFGDEDQAKLRPHREAALAGEARHAEMRLSFPDGQRRDVVVDYIPKTDADGEVHGVFVFIADVTEQKRVERTLRRLHRIISGRESDHSAKLDLIVEAGCAHFELGTGVIGVVEDDRYEVTHACPTNEKMARGSMHPLGRTFCSHMLESEGPLSIDHVGASPLEDSECYAHLGFESYIGAPIEANGQPHGALFFAGPEPRTRTFTGGDREIVRQLADWVGNEIGRDRDLAALRRANAELERLATTDELTGLLNRRELCRRADAEFERARRYGELLSVLLIDLDRFKAVNDRGGHTVGDDVLRRFADAAAATLRPSDVFGRLGGDEFAVVLAHTDISRAHAVAERLRNAVRQRHEFDEGPVELTASVGAAAMRSADTSIKNTIERADRALYAAKSAGRDTSSVFPGGGPPDRDAGDEAGSA